MVPPRSHRVSRVRRYSGSSSLLLPFAYGTFTLFRWPSHTILLGFHLLITVLTPDVFLLLVWPLPLSLATTCGISFDFFSSPYLDVSVRAVPPASLSIQHAVTRHDSGRIAPFGYLWFKRLLTASHSFSQFVASFFGS